MPVVRNFMVRGGADFSAMRKEMQKASKDMADFHSGIKTAMKGLAVTLAGLGIGTVIKDAVKSAMDVESSMQQINRAMGNSAKAFAEWASKGSLAFNMSKSDAIRYGAVYSNLISNFTKDTGTTMKYTEQLLKASAVIASSTGRTMEDVMIRIRSGMLGNTEAIEDLGVNVNVAMITSTDAFRKFANGRSWDQIDFQTQQQIRLFAILEQSHKKYGDVVAVNANSAMQQFTAQLRNVQLSLGQAFMPILAYILPALNRLVGSLATAMAFFAQFSRALFGDPKVPAKTAAALNGQANAVGNLGSAYTAAGQAAQNALAGFDEVNTLGNANANNNAPMGPMTDPMPTDGSGGTGSALEDISAKAKEMAANVKEALQSVKDKFGELKDFIVDNKELIIAALAGITTAFVGLYLAINGEAIIATIKTAFVGLAAIFTMVSLPVLIIIGIIAVLVAAFVYFYQTNEGFRGVVDGILNAIADAAKWLWESVLVPFGKWIGEVFVAAWKGLSSFLVDLWNNVLVPLGSFIGDVFVAYWKALTEVVNWLWLNVLVPLGDFLLWFWNNVLVPLGSILVDVLGVAFTALSNIANSLWQNVMVPLGNFFKTTFGPTVEALSAVVTGLKTVFLYLWDNALSPFATFLSEVLKIVFKEIIDVITFLWKNILKPLSTFIGDVLLTVFTTVFKSIGDIIDGLALALKGVMTFITGVFTGNWEKAWDGVKMIFKGVFDSLYSIVKTPLNLIIDMVNLLISGLNKISITVPDWVPGLGGKSMGINIPSIPHLARGGVTDGTTDMGNYIAGEAGAEMIVPLENTSFVNKLASALGTAVMGAMQFSSGSNNTVIPDIVMDGVVLARAISPYLSQENTRQGSPMIKTSGSAIIVTG